MKSYNKSRLDNILGPTADAKEKAIETTVTDISLEKGNSISKPFLCWPKNGLFWITKN